MATETDRLRADGARLRANNHPTHAKQDDDGSWFDVPCDCTPGGANLIDHWGVVGPHGGVIDYQTRERPARIAAAEGGGTVLRRQVTEWRPE